MLLEYMYKVLKLFTFQNPKKLPLEKDLEEKLNMEFPMLR